jgi:hypothetical protein
MIETARGLGLVLNNNLIDNQDNLKMKKKEVKRHDGT